MSNRSSHNGKRNYGSHTRSMSIRFYFKLAVQFVQALAHSGQADTRFRARFTKAPQKLVSQALQFRLGTESGC
jgi:hypothetical protein